MTDHPQLPDAARILQLLRQSEALKHQPVAGVALDPQLVLLRTWQSNRLAQTYADLLADPGYGPACRFFLTDIYAPRDFSQRDHDIERVYAFLSRLMPAQTLQLLSESVELNNLTNALDNDLLRALVDKLGVTDTITPEVYAEGYRLCDNYAERAHQIELTKTVLTRVGEGAHLRIAGVAMKLARAPAQRGGWVELYDFLERGYAAFKQMRDVKTFVAIIAERETRILDRIFAGQPDPFTV